MFDKADDSCEKNATVGKRGHVHIHASIFFLPDTLKAQRSFLRLFLKNIIFLLNQFISQAIKQGALKYTVFLEKKIVVSESNEDICSFFFQVDETKEN